MDQLNKIEEVSKTEQNNDQVEQSNDSLDDKKLYEEEKKEVPQEVESQNIQEPLEKLNETNAEALNGAQQNADDGKEMVSTSISTSLFKPTNTQGVTEYTTFSEYVNNFSNKLPENLNVCAICEKLGARVQCVLECKRFFHYQCLHLMVTKKEVSDRQINCENCLIRQQICAYCGILCMISPSKFRKCSYDGCQYYFHLSCEDRLKESLYYKNVTSKTFICPSHFCGKCKNHILPEDEKVIECVRCY